MSCTGACQLLPLADKLCFDCLRPASTSATAAAAAAAAATDST